MKVLETLIIKPLTSRLPHIKDNVTGLFKHMTLTNIVWIFVIITILYIFYKWWTHNNSEGFADFQSLTDLLSKQKVNLFATAPIWDNALYNKQPQKKGAALSFWKPSSEVVEEYREIGTCVNDSAEYNMPERNTLLVKGDTKPPVDSALIFSFPDNIISASMYDKDGNEQPSVYHEIRHPGDIDTRLGQLKEHLEQVQGAYDTLKEELETKLSIIEEEALTQTVELCGKDSFFINPVRTYKLKPGQTINIDPGEYNTLRLPIGVKASLTSSAGRTFDFELPYDKTVLNAGKDNLINGGLGPTVNDVLANIVTAGGKKPTVNDFNPAGKYGLGAYNSSEQVNNYDNSTQNLNYNQTADQVYMPVQQREEYGIGAIDTKNIIFSYNHAAGTYNHNYYGRDELYKYYSDMPKSTSNQQQGSGSYTLTYNSGTNIINFATTRGIYGLKKTDDTEGIRTSTSVNISDPQIHKSVDPVSVKYDLASRLTALVTKFKADQTVSPWYITNNEIYDNPEFKSALAKSNTPYDINKFSYDMAFMLTTYKKKLLKSGPFASDIFGLINCCELDLSTTEESLSRVDDFQGYLTRCSITSTVNPEDVLVYATAKRDITAVLEGTAAIINNIIKMINELENLQRDIAENKFTHFPMKIYRPVAPENYTNMGDLIFVPGDTNYKIRKPILDTYACVPSQCMREIRDWLPIDKIWEYSEGDQYLGIYRNPYLQTFRAVTVAGVLPPGKVSKVVACVEKCKLLDDIIQADTCANKFYNANKAVTEGNNLDMDKPLLERESGMYKNEINNREDKLNTMRDLARRLQIQDEKADIINKEHNRKQLQSLVDGQRINMNKLVDKLDTGKHTVDINVKFDYVKFFSLLNQLGTAVPEKLKQQISAAVTDAAKKKLDVLPDNTVNDVLGYCPSPETQGLVVKALVESGCYNCTNLTEQ
jgi:hypothetical protein